MQFVHAAAPRRLGDTGSRRGDGLAQHAQVADVIRQQQHQARIHQLALRHRSGRGGLRSAARRSRRRACRPDGGERRGAEIGLGDRGGSCLGTPGRWRAPARRAPPQRRGGASARPHAGRGGSGRRCRAGRRSVSRPGLRRRPARSGRPGRLRRPAPRPAAAPATAPRPAQRGQRVSRCRAGRAEEHQHEAGRRCAAAASRAGRRHAPARRPAARRAPSSRRRRRRRAYSTATASAAPAPTSRPLLTSARPIGSFLGQRQHGVAQHLGGAALGRDEVGGARAS